MALGLAVMLEQILAQRITLGDNGVPGYNVTVFACEFLVDEDRVGPTIIGDGVMIGATPPSSRG